MIDRSKIRQGLEVFTEDNQSLGTIERVNGDEYYVNGRSYPLSVFTRFEQNRLYVGGDSYKKYTQSGNENSKMSIAEERLNVEKRGGQIGEVEVRKTVTTEQQQIPVELRHDEVNVQQRKVEERPLQAGDTSFQEGTISIPLYGEQAVVNKQAVVTGEVDVNKQQRVERQTIQDSVRKEHVDVVRNENLNDQKMEKMEAATASAPATNMTSSQQTSYNAETTPLREGMEVISSDGQKLGKVKELSNGSFILGRGIFKGDMEVDQRSITNIMDDEAEVNFTKEYLDNLD